MYEEQVGWAVDEGAEFIIAETLDWFVEASLALEVIQAHGVPAVVNQLLDDAALRQRYAANGRRYVEEKLSLAALVPAYEELIDRVAKAR